MKNLIKNFFKIKLTLTPPQTKTFLIFDKNSKVIEKIIGKDFNTLHTRFEKINLIILFYSLIINFKDTLKLKNLYFNYLKTFIIFTKPKYVITSIDNDKRFFKFKKYIKNVKFIAIQNGYRFYKNDLFEAIAKSDYIFECDQYYCFGENVKNYLNNKIKANIYVIGSIKNNFCSKNQKFKNKNVCYISSFGISTNHFEKRILNCLHKFCYEKKINLEILARTNSNEEKLFYSEILKNQNFIFHKQQETFCSSYNIVDSAMISVTINNTLGYENLSRKNKTYFININDRGLYCKSYLKFGYPEKFEDEGFFWTNKFEPKKIIKSMNYIYQLSEKEWENKTQKIIKKIINYEENNFLLKKKLNLLKI